MTPFLSALPLALLLAAAAALPAAAGPFTGTAQSTRLYTKPDPAAGGGIRVRLAPVASPPARLFAVAQMDPDRCYQASHANGTYLFTGLPVGKYDLVAVWEDRFYEGLLLAREPDTLTAKDRDSITAIINASVPYFDTKVIHRMAGATGRAGKSMIVLQELRTRPVLLQSGEERSDIQTRSIKIGRLEDVTIGWQLAATREIIRVEVGGAMFKGPIRHRFIDELGNIRVTDTIKDLGDIRLD